MPRMHAVFGFPAIPTSAEIPPDAPFSAELEPQRRPGFSLEGASMVLVIGVYQHSTAPGVIPIAEVTN